MWSRVRKSGPGGQGPARLFLNTTRMRRTSILQAIGPLLIVAAGVIAFAWLRTLRAPPETNPPITRPPPVRTLELGPPRRQFDIRVSGQVVPGREVTLSAEITGRVVTRPANIRPGRHVTRGTLLLELDPEDYELQLRTVDIQVRDIDLQLERLTTETAGIDALVTLAQEDLKLATSELERIESLLEKKTATPAERDQAKRAELIARNDLRTLENQRDLLPVRRRQLLSRHEAAITRQQQARRNLQRTRITSPFDGLLTLVQAEAGDFVQPGDVVLKVEETAAVEIECHLRADDLYWLRDSLTTPDSPDDDRLRFEVPETTATVTYREADRTHRWTGRLIRFGGQGVDPQTRTVPCRVVVNRRQEAPANDATTVLMRGMYVTVTLPAVPKTSLIAIPAEAVQPNNQVWSVTDNLLAIHRIDVVRVLPDSMLVRADGGTLKPGDRVVVSPLTIAYDDMPVRERAAGELQTGSRSP